MAESPGARTNGLLPAIFLFQGEAEDAAVELSTGCRVTDDRAEARDEENIHGSHPLQGLSARMLPLPVFHANGVTPPQPTVIDGKARLFSLDWSCTITRNVRGTTGSLLNSRFTDPMITSFIKALFRGSVPMNEEVIGKAAGDIWRLLAEQGPIPFRELANSLGEDRDLVAMAVGWLGRENKLSFTPKGKALVLALKEHELAKSGV